MSLRSFDVEDLKPKSEVEKVVSIVSDQTSPFCHLHHGDCLKLMADLPDACVDMIAVDLPYGTTYADWDVALPMDQLWAHYQRIIRGNGAIIFTTSQPFTSLVVVSNLPWFRCEWIWNKVHATNFANANRQPLKVHESVLVFARGQTTYNPIKVSGAVNHKQGKSTVNISETRLINKRVDDDLSGLKFPVSIETFPKHSSQCGLHPTQKPVALMDYFIRTYSNPGDVVLDNCMGSGTTGVAALESGRSFIGMEERVDYFEVARGRIEKAKT